MHDHKNVGHALVDVHNGHVKNQPQNGTLWSLCGHLHSLPPWVRVSAAYQEGQHSVDELIGARQRRGTAETCRCVVTRKSTEEQLHQWNGKDEKGKTSHRPLVCGASRDDGETGRMCVVVVVCLCQVSLGVPCSCIGSLLLALNLVPGALHREGVDSVLCEGVKCVVWCSSGQCNATQRNSTRCRVVCCGTVWYGGKGVGEVGGLVGG